MHPCLLGSGKAPPKRRSQEWSLPQCCTVQGTPGAFTHTACAWQPAVQQMQYDAAAAGPQGSVALGPTGEDNHTERGLLEQKQDLWATCR